jgi:hypothetical protein
VQTEHRRRHAGCGGNLDAVRGKDGIGGNQGVERLAQAPTRQRRRPGDVFARDDQQVDVAIELQVLKAVVEDVDRRPEVVLGEAAGEVAIRTGQHGRARQLPRQHQRLVARARQVGADAARIAHDDDAVAVLGAAVAAAQDRGPLAHLEQRLCDICRHRRLAAAANRKVADADDRSPEPLPQVGASGVAFAPPSHDRGIDGAQQTWITRLS